MQSTLSQMHEERLTEQESSGEPSPVGGLADDLRSSTNDRVNPSGQEDGLDPWLNAASKAVAQRQASKEFIDKRSRAQYPPNGSAVPHEHSDELLFSRYQQGDDAAFLALYERYKANIYAYCAQVILSVGLPREIVDDTFQDVFLRLTQYKETFTGGEFNKWIFTVTRHSCLSAKKKAFRHRSTTETIGDGENFDDATSNEVRSAFSHSDDPLERMSKVEQTDLLLKAIAKLPDEFREALLMSEYEGLTYEEIGRITGTSLSTIRIRIFRAKARLRKMLLPIIGDDAGLLYEGPNSEG